MAAIEFRSLKQSASVRHTSILRLLRRWRQNRHHDEVAGSGVFHAMRNAIGSEGSGSRRNRFTLIAHLDFRDAFDHYAVEFVPSCMGMQRMFLSGLETI